MVICGVECHGLNRCATFRGQRLSRSVVIRGVASHGLHRRATFHGFSRPDLVVLWGLTCDRFRHDSRRDGERHARRLVVQRIERHGLRHNSRCLRRCLEPIAWSFGVSQATGSATIPGVSGQATSISWSFGVSQATGTTVALAFTGNATPITWSFGVSRATGSTVILVFSGIADPIQWSFSVSNPGTGATSVLGRPSPPLNVMVSTANNEDTITFNAPTDDGNSPLDYYEVEFEGGDGRWYLLKTILFGQPRMAVNQLSVLEWHTSPPDTTRDTDSLFQSFRRVVGNPVAGDPVPGMWIEPYLVSRWGEDGIGIEEVFAVTNSATLPQNQRPDNAWGYNNPGTVNGVQWFDGAPNVTSQTPYLWRSRRRIVGAPVFNAPVDADWDEPTVSGRWGPDGADGQGQEHIYAVNDSATIPQGQRPSNNWPYDVPGTIGGLTWYDNPPDLTDILPILWRVSRMVVGQSRYG